MARLRMKLYALKALAAIGHFVLRAKVVVEFMLRLLGPIFFCLGFSLISYAVYVHYTFVLTWYSGKPAFSFTLFSLVHNSMGIWLCIGIAWNFTKAAFTPALDFGQHLTPAEIAIAKANSQNLSSRQNSRFCKYCEKGKVDRMHHCHVCKTCVPGMDHHCPWIGNCVGFHNHHYFILFLLYLLAGCLYASTMSFFPFLIALDSTTPWPYTTTRSAVVFSFILAAAVACSLTFLSGWQLYCVLKGQTSVEFYLHQRNAKAAAEVGRGYRNPNDHGVQKNFQNFFGMDANSWWFAWLVPGMSNPVYTPQSLGAALKLRLVDEIV